MPKRQSKKIMVIYPEDMFAKNPKSKPQELRPYQKRMKKLNSTRFTSKEGRITLQTDSLSEPLVFGWLASKPHGAWVLCSVNGRYYEEVPITNLWKVDKDAKKD